MNYYFMAIMCALFISPALVNADMFVKYDVVTSGDEQKIAYSVSGSGNTTLVFVHGWSCDSRYWQRQLSSFEKKYRVIAIDLAGHGNSSSSRGDYTIDAFAEDVRSVLDNEKASNAILIGHSMGGAIIASAATLMPERVKGIIGIDTLQNVGERIPREMLNSMVKPFETNFDHAMKEFVAESLLESTDENLKRWITEDMSAAPRSVAINAFGHYLSRYVTGESSTIFGDVNVPVVTINSRLWPTDPEENNKHIKDYRLVYIENTGHFPMLESPEEFNSLLTEAVEKLLAATSN